MCTLSPAEEIGHLIKKIYISFKLANSIIDKRQSQSILINDRIAIRENYFSVSLLIQLLAHAEYNSIK